MSVVCFAVKERIWFDLIIHFSSVHSLDAFISYLRTRESVLRRHYSTSSLLRGGPGAVGGTLAPLNSALASLATITFSLDILWQLRDMHRSFKRMEDLMAHQVGTAYYCLTLLPRRSCNRKGYKNMYTNTIHMPCNLRLGCFKLRYHYRMITILKLSHLWRSNFYARQLITLGLRIDIYPDTIKMFKFRNGTDWLMVWNAIELETPQPKNYT